MGAHRARGMRHGDVCHRQQLPRFESLKTEGMDVCHTKSGKFARSYSTDYVDWAR